MEAGATQRYANSLKAYGDNIAGLKSALNEGVTLRQNNRLNAIANTQREKLQNIFMSNVVEDEKLREIHEAMSGLSVTAGAAPEAIMKLGTALNKAGAFNPLKRAGANLASKVRQLGTSSRLSGTQTADEPVEGESSYTPATETELRNPPRLSLRSTMTRSAEPAPRAGAEEPNLGQAGRSGQSLDEDPDSFMGDRSSTFRSARGAGSSGADALEDAGSSAIEEGAGSAAAEAETAAATAAETAGTAAAEGAGVAAGEGAAAAAGGLGAALGTVATIAGPLSVLAGLGFGIYELVEAFKPRPHPDMGPQKVASQVKQQATITPSHRTLSVAPGANSALLQAGGSSAV